MNDLRMDLQRQVRAVLLGRLMDGDRITVDSHTPAGTLRALKWLFVWGLVDNYRDGISTYIGPTKEVQS